MRMRGQNARVIFWLAGMLLLAMPAYGEETFSIAGNVTFPEAEVIFVSLYTPERFQDFKNKSLPPEPYTQIIELSAEQKNGGRAAFVFKGIPKGTYGVVAFREMKKNLKRERSEYFRNPVSCYKMIRFSGNWNDIKLEVNKNIHGIEIRF